MTTSRGGRPADPSGLKALKGITDKRRVNRDEPTVREEPPIPPAWVDDLPDDVQARWRGLWAETCRQGSWLRASESDLLAQYVIAVVDAERLGRALLRSPLLERDPASGGPKVLTVRREWRAAVDTMTRLAREFGLTPVARQALKSSLLGDDPSRSHLHAVGDIFDGV